MVKRDFNTGRTVTQTLMKADSHKSCCNDNWDQLQNDSKRVIDPMRACYFHENLYRLQKQSNGDDCGELVLEGQGMFVLPQSGRVGQWNQTAEPQAIARRRPFERSKN